MIPEDETPRVMNTSCYKRLEQWEALDATGTRVLRKLAKNGKRKRDDDEC